MKRKRLIATIVIVSMMAMITGCGDKKAEGDSGEKVAETQNKEETESASEQPEEEISAMEQFEKDVKDGLLYENDQGQVTDKDGNVLQEYDWVIRNDYSTLAMMDGDTYVTLDHFWIDENGMITYDEEVEFTEPGPVESTGNAYLDNLRNNVANRMRENASVVINEVPFGTGDTRTQIASDMSEFHSDIIFGNWWVDHQINGTPVADSIPKTLATAIINSDYSTGSYAEFDASTILANFRFIDQDTCSVESVKRMESTDTTLYGFYLQNSQKNTDENGNRYFTGYIDTDYVAVYGDFDKILNGDNVFMYADFVGLSDNDIPIFVGAYAEIITD